ncbi:MAG TPA: hypothetical protein VFA04_08275 [Bryobacteraceae bacterium]|nr:hypothetical protein [Bryobacteraceae bacterium]
MAALFIVPKPTALDLVERLSLLLTHAEDPQERAVIERTMHAHLRTWSPSEIGRLFEEVSKLYRMQIGRTDDTSSGPQRREEPQHKKEKLKCPLY